jgi:hypothetical protein
MHAAVKTSPEAVFVHLTAATEWQSLAAVVQASGIAPCPELKLELTVPAHASIKITDDLQLHGFVKAALHFIVLEYAFLEYQLREVAGLVDDGTVVSSVSLDRNITCTLAGAGADAQVRCLYFGNDAHTFKIKTHQEHIARNATSNVVIKAVLDGAARLTCNSLISVAPGANGTNAEQVNKNILLSSAARAVSIPMLEVLANDVKCKHGAAVSKLDSEQLFYLQSRGLGLELTKSMLLQAFLN